MSDAEIIAALQEERRGYVLRGLSDRVADVDSELARLGSAPPVDPTSTVEEAGGASARSRSGRRG